MARTAASGQADMIATPMLVTPITTAAPLPVVAAERDLRLDLFAALRCG